MMNTKRELSNLLLTLEIFLLNLRDSPLFLNCQLFLEDYQLTKLNRLINESQSIRGKLNVKASRRRSKSSKILPL